MLRTLTPRQLVFDIAVPTGLGLVLLPWYYAREPLWVVVLLGMCAALALWRLQPALALTIAWATALFQVFTVVSPDPANVAIPIVLYATSAYGSRRMKWFGFASTFVGAAVVTITLLGTTDIGNLISEQIANPSSSLIGAVAQASFIFLGSLAVFLLSWTLGIVGSAIMRAGESRRAAVVAVEEVAAEQERTRIARDMHDVVAHSLAVVVAQADGARYLRTTDPDAVDGALQTIATTAREALSDVRVLLAQLRHSQGDGPQPTLVDLDRLYEQLRLSGLTIRQEVAGTPLLMGTSGQLAVYRIVQESLTNALRHADLDQDVLARFTWTPYGLDLTVASAVRPVSTRTAENSLALPSGHGIAGMRERAALVGGRLTAERDGDTFVVHAWLPAGQPTQPIDIVRPSTASVPAKESHPMTTPIRVALVDDQALFRTGIRMLVSSQPDLEFVGEAGTGLEGVQLAAHQHPDVILMDIRMPVMDGIEATERILAAADAREASGSGGVRPRVIVLTTFDLDEAATRAIRGGASGFLLKDSDPEFLLASIRAVHAGTAVVAPGAMRELFRHFDSRQATVPQPDAFGTLTARERDVFVLAARGLSNSEIAGAEFLSEATVKTHISRILSKLSLRDRVQLVVYAFEHRLTAD